MKRPSETWGLHSGSTQSAESALDMERSVCGNQNPSSCIVSTLQPYASGAQHSESNAAYFSWPTSTLMHDSAEGRANYFGNLQKGVLPGNLGRLPKGQQATTLLDLMTIRAFHSKILRRYSLGTAIGFRIRQGKLTETPAILVFVARKVHRKWLKQIQCLPTALEGPGGVWCDVDVVEFSYYGAPAHTPKEQLYTELVDGLRGSYPCIGSGSQVANLETYGTLGAIVKSRTGNKQVGFLTNRHVAVDLDYPNQKMFHPLPPNLGPGVYLGAVERATSFITDDLWYGIYAGTNPETFVRADGAFIPFADDFDLSNVTTSVNGVGDIGDVKVIDLQSPIKSLIGRQVVKVGRSSGLTTGTVMAYALEYNDEKGICFFTDFLVVGENHETFDLEGDSGSLIILTAQDGEKPQPVGIIWGGTANRGRLKLRSGHGPENWTSGVDLGRLLDLLELDLITTNKDLQEALQEQRLALVAAVDSTVGESSLTIGNLPNDKADDIYKPLDINLVDGAAGSGINDCYKQLEFQVDIVDTVKNVEEHQFITSFAGASPLHKNQEDNPEQKTLSALRNSSEEDVCVSLHLGDREPKRQRSEPAFSIDSPK
ncbi:protein NARROW LEAF 1 isoform X1 [Dendrobium catenatum]|uniref:protein NARROW LEAF 1 isoform X1 n=2 Tax=Dendrobium catenatum TaxID=906689 RepID=UPI0009F5AE60|nr:protein NARROW LEAF 1 isoform X1 [Dendrobium catenatum]XP_020705045.1 protein NARROW LEAF 1 isoform X1 [Dendrobium catenatum]XP_020705046.1 protein NARROW LEAF 1 isoform X1 [Dendrobium catenatum]XP_028550747.1 protein NARROW LEAF 1 isoform X1 [Dendrobium catenatum]XP_028550748.1 protein NARROW LEAF 1 isoform X1 [Dendrobium catenatum]XP_028550749.1 protein NARROW LEAF 1 isoform X1 [Dendrobium catenatum]